MLGFAAVNTGNNLLFLVVSGLLAFMAVTGYAGMVNLQGLVPQVLPDDDLFAGSPGRCRLLLRNEKQRIPSFLILLTSPGRGETLVPFISAGQSIETSINLTFQQRGRHSIGQVAISSPFPVIFFTRYWKFQLVTTCIVYPRLIATDRQQAADEVERTGEMSQRQRGQDGELEGIREYASADPLRAIHWKLSARSDTLQVKEFGSQSAPPLMIRPETLPGTTVEEQLSRAAWLIVQRVMLQPVGLVLDSQTILPASGRQQAVKLLTELALYGHH